MTRQADIERRLRRRLRGGLPAVFGLAASVLSQPAAAQPVIGAQTPLTPYCENGSCAVIGQSEGAAAPQRDVIHLYTPQTIPYPEDPEKRRELGFYSDLAAAIRDIKSDHESAAEHAIVIHAGEHRFDTIVFREEPKSFTLKAYPGDELAARLVPNSGRCFDIAPWDMPGAESGHEIRFRNLTIAPATGRQLDICISAANVSLAFENAELSLLNHYGVGIAMETDALRLEGVRLLGMRVGEGANEFSAAGAVIGERARLSVKAGGEGNPSLIAGFAAGLKISGDAEIGAPRDVEPALSAGASMAEEAQTDALSILKPPPPPRSVDFFLNRIAVSLDAGSYPAPADGGVVTVRDAAFSMDLLQGSTGIEVGEGFVGALDISDTDLSGWNRAGVGLRASAADRGAYRPEIVLRSSSFERLDAAIETAASLNAFDVSFDQNRSALTLRYSGEASPDMIIEDSEFTGNDFALELAGGGGGALVISGTDADMMRRRMVDEARGVNDVRLLPGEGAGLVLGCSFGTTKSDRMIRSKIAGKLGLCE